MLPVWPMGAPSHLLAEDLELTSRDISRLIGELLVEGWDVSSWNEDGQRQASIGHKPRNKAELKWCPDYRRMPSVARTLAKAEEYDELVHGDGNTQ